MLTATETDRDLDVLFAMGAPPRLRPQVLARQAWLVTTLGAVLAVLLNGVAALVDLYDVPAIGWVAQVTVVAVVAVMPVLIASCVRLGARRGRATATIRLT